MGNHSASERSERAAIVRCLAICVALVGCGACTSTPHFLRPPTPRAVAPTDAQAMHTGQGIDIGQEQQGTAI